MQPVDQITACFFTELRMRGCQVILFMVIVLQVEQHFSGEKMISVVISMNINIMIKPYRTLAYMGTL